MTIGYFYDTVLGKIGLIEENEKLIRLLLPGECYFEEFVLFETPFLMYVSKELREYFQGLRTTFTIPCNPRGTLFQKTVWSQVAQIPYGTVMSYKEIAHLVGNGKACRAIGMANHHNPIPIIIPCHRVIGANGKLTGYAGGLSLKKKLLELEGIKLENNRISCSR